MILNRIAVYKALYRLFGGFVSDVVAAIEQAVHDGVDIINLSVGPNSPPATTRTTFLNNLKPKEQVWYDYCLYSLTTKT
jgi:subtilisin family serine protease